MSTGIDPITTAMTKVFTTELSKTLINKPRSTLCNASRDDT